MARVLGNYIKDFRKRNNMRQQVLADKLEINRTYLSKLENFVHNPSPELMMRVCDVFDCDIGDMFSIKLVDEEEFR